MKHKLYDMIVAKAENTNLVVFSRFNGSPWIRVVTDYNKTFSFLEEYEYFLCLPQHEEVCLAWLNGAEVQYRDREGIWLEVGSNEYFWKEWCCGHMLMDECAEVRIKPKKVKRWIAVFPNDSTTSTFKSEMELKKYVGDESKWGWEIIEIEVTEK